KVVKLLDEQGIQEPVTVAGVSMGGYMAMAFARQFPERLGALVLADTKAEGDDAKAKEGRATMIKLARDKGSAAVARAMLPRMLGPTTLGLGPTVVDKVYATMARQPVEKVIAALVALRDRPDATAGLKTLRAPTLVIVGEDDIITPLAMAKAIAETVKESR